MMDLAQEVLKGNPRAIARAISLVENNGIEAQELMKKLFPCRKESVVLGITGAPGSGKSTLVDRMIASLREEGKTIGIVAVDPSSPFTGGAILGDRIRMMHHSTDAGVFIRSMATRGYLGGLAKATGEAITIFEAAGKDLILVETVGVGQDEVEVVKLADIVVVVLNPGAGDDIQVFKAGIMEIGNIFVLNKADSAGAEKMERQIKAVLELGSPGTEIPPVVKTVATRRTGVDGLMEEIRKLASAKNHRVKARKKKQLISWMLKDITREKIYRALQQHIKDSEFEDFVDQIFNRETDPYTVSDELIRRLRGKL